MIYSILFGFFVTGETWGSLSDDKNFEAFVQDHPQHFYMG